MWDIVLSALHGVAVCFVVSKMLVWEQFLSNRTSVPTRRSNRTVAEAPAHFLVLTLWTSTEACPWMAKRSQDFTPGGLELVPVLSLGLGPPVVCTEDAFQDPQPLLPTQC